MIKKMVVEEGIKYRYEFSDDKSNKFWEITVNGNTYSDFDTEFKESYCK